MYTYSMVAFICLLEATTAIGDAQFVSFMPLPDAFNEPTMNDESLLKSNSMTTLLVQHPCNPETSVLISNFVYLSQDAFRTPVHPLAAPPNIFSSDTAYVTCVAFVKDAVLLTVDGVLLMVDLLTLNMTIASGISSAVNRVVTAPCCYAEDTTWCRAHDSMVFTFDSELTTDEPSVWWSEDGGHRFELVNVTTQNEGPSVISNVFLHPLKHESTLLVQVDSSSTVMMHFNHLTHQFEDWSETIPFSTRGVYIPAIQLNYKSESFIFSSGSTIYYSPVAGAAMRPVHFNRNDTDHLNPDEEIIIVTPGYSEYFLLVTNQQRVLLGREEGMTAEVIEILQGVYDSDVGLAFDDEGNVHLYTPWSRADAASTQAVDFHKTTYSVHGLVHTHDSAPCKYQAILNDYDQRIFYLDIAMEMDLSITMYSEPWQQADFIVFVSNPDLLQFSSGVTAKRHNTIRGVTENSMSTHISLRVDTVSESTIDGVTGMSIIRMGSLDSSLKCLQDQHTESLVIGGCPPGRHIKVRKQNTENKTNAVGKMTGSQMRYKNCPDTICDNWKDESYTIRKDLYDPTYFLGRTNVGAQDVTLTFDLDELGCPFLVHYADPFKPIIDLFDGDAFVEEVLVNYVVYDVNGRYTFGYTMNMAEALCVSQAQDWLTMLQAQEQADPYSAWTYKNFVSCYDESGSDLVDPEQAYEILNSSSSNKLKWQPYSGLYIFNVTVVDPNYSFCFLTAQFAVEVYGALPEAPFPQMRIMLGICAFGVLSVWFLYGTYSVVTKSEEQNSTE